MSKPHFKNVHIQAELHISDWVTLYQALQSHKLYMRFRAEVDSWRPSEEAATQANIARLEQEIVKLLTPFHV